MVEASALRVLTLHSQLLGALLVGFIGGAAGADDVGRRPNEVLVAQAASAEPGGAESGEGLKAQVLAAWRERAGKVRSLRAKFETVHQEKDDRRRSVEAKEVEGEGSGAEKGEGAVEGFVNWTTQTEVRMADQRRTYYALSGPRWDEESGLLKKQDYEDAFDGEVNAMLFAPTEERATPSGQTSRKGHADGFVIIRATAPLRWWFSALDPTMSEFDLSSPGWQVQSEVIDGREMIRMRRSPGDRRRDTFVVDAAEGFSIVQRTQERSDGSEFQVIAETKIQNAEDVAGVWRPRGWSYVRYAGDVPTITETSTVSEWESNVNFDRKDFQIKFPANASVNGLPAATRIGSVGGVELPPAESGDAGQSASGGESDDWWSPSVIVGVNAVILCVFGMICWMVYRRR
jgi:hypothetical protein